MSNSNRSRQDLGTLLDHIKDSVDELAGDGTARLAEAFVRMSDDDGTLRLDDLPQTDVDQLWALVDGIAQENGVVWEVE